MRNIRSYGMICGIALTLMLGICGMFASPRDHARNKDPVVQHVLGALDIPIAPNKQAALQVWTFRPVLWLGDNTTLSSRQPCKWHSRFAARIALGRLDHNRCVCWVVGMRTRDGPSSTKRT